MTGADIVKVCYDQVKEVERLNAAFIGPLRRVVIDVRYNLHGQRVPVPKPS